MAPRGGRKGQLLALQQRNRERIAEQAEAGEGCMEEGEDEAPAMSTRSKRPKRPSQLESLRLELQQTEAQLEDADTRLQASESALSAALGQCDEKERQIHSLELQARRLQQEIDALREELTASDEFIDELTDEHTTQSDALRKTSAQVTRLKRDRKNARVDTEAAQSAIEDELTRERESATAERLQNISLHAQNEFLDVQLAKAVLAAKQLRHKYKQARNEREMYKKRADRAKPALEVARKALKDMKVWNSKDGKMYSGRTRRLLRRLDAAGVACSRIPQVLSVVFQELGIKAKCIPSPRTIRLAVKEGGFFAKMKVGRALANAKSYGLSSDGTTIKRVNYESRHIKVATTDPANPTAKPVFERLVLDLNHAHDHTAATQLEGDLAAGAAVRDAWNNSPLCADEKITLERHDFLRKQKYQNMDHAKDGKSKLNLTRELKVLVAKDDLGKAEFAELSDLDRFNELCKITQEDLEEVYGPESVAQMSTSERNQARALILVQRLGDVAFDKLSEEQQRKIADIIFAGCMCHKDLNAFGYAVEELEAMWPKNDGPSLLANKANDATIRLSQDPNSAALQKALESSTRGAMKLVELCAMVFRNSNDITGYQLLTTNFMERRKSECYPEEVRIGLINPRNLFPDFQRARFQTGSHGAAELFMFLDLYTELVETVIASKHNSGQANHIESNLLKGFRCLKTQTELAAETLYAVCVSWPYMRYARGGGSEAGGLINLLDTVDFHRKIVPFCKRFAAQPELLLDTATPDSELTIDGQPFMDQLVVTKIRSRAAELPEFHRALTATFNGAIKGWEIFTEEFKVGGEFDKLTDAEKAEMQIDSTNDANEGGLGFLRQQFLKNPAGTIDFFRARAMYRRNNTESFISNSASSKAMAVYAMRETRKQDSSGSQKQFRLERANRLIQKATTNNEKRERRLQEEADRRARLLATPVITQIPKLNMLNVKQLTAQMQIHWRIFKDPILCAIPNKSILKKKADLLAAVKGAVARYLIRTKNARRTRLQGDDTDAELEDSAESDTDASDLDSADAWGGIDDGDTVGVGLPDAEDSDDDEGMSGEPPLRGFDEHMDVD